MNTILPIVERFHSLQGEGIHFGKSAFFIRLAGCNVKCPWCDTKESWSMISHPKETISQLAHEAAIAQTNGAEFLVITGGEPLHHNLNTLCEAIKTATTTKNNQAMPIHLETSGVNEISGTINWITLSPKRHLHPRKSLLQICDELKVIIFQEEDLIFAEEMAEKSMLEKKKTGPKEKSRKPHLFLQPGWNSQEGKKLAIEYIKSHPKWRLSLQGHKLIGIP